MNLTLNIHVRGSFERRLSHWCLMWGSFERRLSHWCLM
jgi:hypothetical protein